MKTALKKTRIRFWLGCFVLSLPFAFAACGNGEKDAALKGVPDEPAEEQVVVYGGTTSPNGLQPCRSQALNQPGTYLSELVFDGLANRVGIKKNGRQEVDWSLVDIYTESGFSTAERRLVKVSLMQGVYWHDGREFTSDDVIFSWKALKASDSPIKGWLMSFIRDMRKIDSHTVEVRLHVERSEEVAKELLSSFKIVPAALKAKGGQQSLPADLNSQGLAQDFARKPVGTGPFKVEEFKGSMVKLSANTDYFKGPPRLKGFVFRRVEDYAVLLKSLKQGNLSLMMDVRPESKKNLDDTDLKSTLFYPYTFDAVVYNFRRPPFDDPAFRRAVNRATDKVALAGRRFPGMDVSDFLNTSIFPHNYAYVQEAPEGDFAEAQPYDLKKAARLLKKTKARKFTLLICSELDGARVQEMAREYADMMKKAGLKVTVSDQGAAQYHAQIKKRNFDAAFLRFSGFDHFYDIRSLFAKTGKHNILAFGDKKLAADLEAFGRTISHPELCKITRSIHKRVEAFNPGCFLFTLPQTAYFDNRMTSVIIHPEVGFSKADQWAYR